MVIYQVDSAIQRLTSWGLIMSRVAYTSGRPRRQLFQRTSVFCRELYNQRTPFSGAFTNRHFQTHVRFGKFLCGRNAKKRILA